MPSKIFSNLNQLHTYIYIYILMFDNFVTLLCSVVQYVEALGVCRVPVNCPDTGPVQTH